jgi:hypothetical protein
VIQLGLDAQKKICRASGTDPGAGNRFSDGEPSSIMVQFLRICFLCHFFASISWMPNSELAPQPVAFYAAVFFLVNATYICLILELHQSNSD